jgi:hypothetical protein
VLAVFTMKMVTAIYAETLERLRYIVIRVLDYVLAAVFRKLGLKFGNPARFRRD